MAKQTNGSAELTNGQLQNFDAFNRLAMDAFTRGCQCWMEGAAVVNKEVMSFVGTRLRQDAEFAEKFAKCDNWIDASKVQQAWIKQTTEEYSAETSKLVEVATKATAEGLAPLKENAEQMLTALNAPPAG